MIKKLSGLSLPLEKRYFLGVDGLRAIAVMLVVIFHASQTSLSGGFIGVDVFFVISGFLITRNIISQMQAGTWSFSQFYLRRVARLFPALYMTIVVTLFASFFILNPIELERVGKSWESLSSNNFICFKYIFLVGIWIF